jgi:hypothetical protein
LLLRLLRIKQVARYWWLKVLILETWEVEMGRIKIQSQSGQIIYETLPLSKITRTK